jgi:hypothetical protein
VRHGWKLLASKSRERIYNILSDLSMWAERRFEPCFTVVHTARFPLSCREKHSEIASERIRLHRILFEDESPRSND